MNMKHHLHAAQQARLLRATSEASCDAFLHAGGVWGLICFCSSIRNAGENRLSFSMIFELYYVLVVGIRFDWKTKKRIVFATYQNLDYLYLTPMTRWVGQLEVNGWQSFGFSDLVCIDGLVRFCGCMVAWRKVW